MLVKASQEFNPKPDLICDFDNNHIVGDDWTKQETNCDQVAASMTTTAFSDNRTIPKDTGRSQKGVNIMWDINSANFSQI